jgi:hypothetical protein
VVIESSRKQIYLDLAKVFEQFFGDLLRTMQWYGVQNPVLLIVYNCRQPASQGFYIPETDPPVLSLEREEIGEHPPNGGNKVLGR